MVISNVTGVKIAGIGAAVSNDWLPLTAFGKDDEQAMINKFMKKTGVRGRYNAGGYQTTADFCYVAARELLENKNVCPKEIGILVFVTQTPDYCIPATACVLQKRLGLSRECIAFDVNLGCSGFTYGLNIVSSLMISSNVDKALLLAGDTSAKEKSIKRKAKTSHSASMLFGDSGTATLLEKDKSAEPIHMISRTDGEGYKAIIIPYGGWRNPDAPEGVNPDTSTMDDVAVFNFAISEVPEILDETMALAGCSPEDYDALVLHQANLFIIKQIMKRTGFPAEKTLISLDQFGNTSSASIPISLVKEYGDVAEGRKIHMLACGFGVGLSWSTADCYVNTEDVLPLIHTDEYFVDGYGDNDGI